VLPLHAPTKTAWSSLVRIVRSLARRPLCLSHTRGGRSPIHHQPLPRSRVDKGSAHAATRVGVGECGRSRRQGGGQPACSARQPLVVRVLATLRNILAGSHRRLVRTALSLSTPATPRHASPTDECQVGPTRRLVA
jgi:hypothetical protein